MPDLPQPPPPPPAPTPPQAATPAPTPSKPPGAEAQPTPTTTPTAQTVLVSPPAAAMSTRAAAGVRRILDDPDITVRERVMQFKAMGYSYAQIAANMNLDQRTVWGHVQRALEIRRRELNETTDQSRALMLDRLNAIHSAVAATSGITKRNQDGSQGEISLEHVDRLMKLNKQMAELLGLDAPQRVQIAFDVIDSAGAKIAATLMPFIPPENHLKALQALKRLLIDMRGDKKK